MKLGRRILAVMMAVLMLISMMPTAMATVVECTKHDWTPWYNNGATMCGEEYSRWRNCQNCGEQEYESWTIECIPGPWQVVEWPTDCKSEDGLREQTCKNCGTTISQEEFSGDHKWSSWRWAHGEPTCGEGAWKVRECTVCGQIDDQWVAAGDHNWGSWKTVGSASCVEKGKEERTCSICGKTETRTGNYGEHKWGEWKITDKGNCQNPGKEERKCSVCGKTESRTTEEGSHKWGSWKTKKDATCTEKGKEERKCSLCGKEQKRDIDKLGHKWGAWTVIQEAKPGQVGIRERKCSNCGLTQREEFYPDGTYKKGDKGDTVEDIQGALNDLGFNCGTVDGDFGGKTENAVEKWQESNGYPVDGILWPDQVDELLGNDNKTGATAADVVFYKVVTSTPANGEYYTPGETITYAVDLTVPEGYQMIDIEITDPMKGSNEDSVLVREPEMTGPGGYAAIYDHVVTEAEADAGSLSNTATLTWWDPVAQLQRTLTSTVVAATGHAKKATAYVGVQKSVVSMPANGEYYQTGETVQYAIDVAIPAGKTVESMGIFDELNGSPEGSVLDIIPSASGTYSYSYSHVITEEDVARGYVSNRAGVNYFDPVLQDWVESYSGTVYVSTSPDTDLSELEQGNLNILDPDTPSDEYYVITGIPTQIGGIESTKRVISAPANGQYYVPGETVEFEIEMVNTGTLTLEDVTVFDAMDPNPSSVNIYFMEPGSVWMYDFQYVVTLIDAVNGQIVNSASVVGYDPEGRAQVAFTNEVIVPTGMDGDFPFGVITSMDIVKEETSAPANGTYYTEGETISYSITYTNTGETPFGETLIYDTLKNDGVEIASAEMLNPGESRTCTFSYVVTAEDVAKGYVANSAIAKYDIGGGYTNTAISNVVVSDTDGDPNTTYVPGTGVIDWEKIRGTGKDENGNALPNEDTCYMKAVSRDGDSIEYEIHFCTKHAQTQNSILTMANAAGDDASKQQMVWEYAYALWQKEIDAMYEEILPACDDTAKITVMSERVTHLAMVANTQFALQIAEPGQPAETAHAVAELWQDKCIDLCYLMNTAPSERVDSIFAVERTQNEAEIYETCSCVIAEEAEGKLLFADEYCPAHGFTYEMMELLLLTEDSVENWATVRSLWEIELQTVYNALYKAASEEGGTAYLAEYAAYLAWLPAYEQFITTAYPENPEIVAEVMVNTIMERTLDACGRMK